MTTTKEPQRMEHHTMGIVWQEIWNAFLNRDENLQYFLDRMTGEIFAVPADHPDEELKQELNRDAQFLPIPPYDYDQERHLLMGFITGLDDPELKSILERSFKGVTLYGKVDEILSFYPEEQERWQAYRDNLLTNRIKSWLEEHDIYPDEFTH